MEPRFDRRKEQLLAGCQVPPTLFRGVMNRLEDFAQPFVASLLSPESGPRTRNAARRPGSPRTSRTARVTKWRWRCSGAM